MSLDVSCLCGCTREILNEKFSVVNTYLNIFQKNFFWERVKALAAVDCVRTRQAPAANKSNFVKNVYYAISIVQLRIKILCKCTLLKFFKLFLKNPVKIGE